MSMSVHIFLSCMQMCQSRFRYCLCLYNISDVYVYCVFIYKLLFLSFPPFCPLAFSIFLLLELVNKNIDFYFLWPFGISGRTCKFSFHFAAVPAPGLRPKRLCMRPQNGSGCGRNGSGGIKVPVSVGVLFGMWEWKSVEIGQLGFGRDAPYRQLELRRLCSRVDPSQWDSMVLGVWSFVSSIDSWLGP